MKTMKRRQTAPHSEEAERAMLGALLLEPLRLAQVRTRLEPRDWHLELHRMVYQTFLAVADAGATPDLLTLQAHLRQAGTFDAVGGLAYLTALDLDLPDLGRLLDEYVAIVKERSVRRDLMTAADLGGRVLVWLTESRLWAEGTPPFSGPRGALSAKSIYKILERYRRLRRARRC